MNKYKQNLIWFSFFTLLFAFILLFVKIYLTDKIIVPTQILNSMYKNRSLFGVNIRCGDQAGNYATWAEEPPIYHIIGIIFHRAFGGLIFLKVLPFIFLSFYIAGLKKSYEVFFKEKLEIQYAFLLFLIPFIYIHLTRSLPDILSITFLVWFFYYWIRENILAAFVLALLSVTTKTLAIFPIFFIMGHYLLFTNEKPFLKRLVIGLFFSLSLVPSIIWFYYLYFNNINNPFFEIPFSGLHHLNSGSIDVLYFKRKFWSKVMTWVIIRGISIPFTLLIFWGIFKKKITKISFLGFLFVGHLIYVLFTNPMQVSAPWYSFYFLFIYLLYSLNLLKKLEIKLQLVLSLIVILHSLFMVDYSKNIKANLDYGNIIYSSAIPCNFHDYFRHAKNMILN